MRNVVIAIGLGFILAGTGTGTGATAAFAADAPTPDATDLEACALLASVLPANLPDYLVSNAFLDLDGDGSLERLAIAYEGTADVADIYVTHADGSNADITYSDAYDDPTGSLLGDVRWLVFAGRAYVATFDGGGAGYLHYLSRIDASYTERPLCSFAPQTKVSLLAVAKEEQAICDAVASGKAKFADVQKLSPQPVPMRDLPGGQTSIVGKATVDFANTGHPAAVYLLNAESGAGAGCELAYYDTKPDDRSSAAHRELMAMPAEPDGQPVRG